MNNHGRPLVWSSISTDITGMHMMSSRKTYHRDTETRSGEGRTVVVAIGKEREITDNRQPTTDN